MKELGCSASTLPLEPAGLPTLVCLTLKLCRVAACFNTRASIPTAILAAMIKHSHSMYRSATLVVWHTFRIAFSKAQGKCAAIVLAWRRYVSAVARRVPGIISAQSEVGATSACLNGSAQQVQGTSIINSQVTVAQPRCTGLLDVKADRLEQYDTITTLCLILGTNKL